MEYTIGIKKKVLKGLKKFPVSVQKKFKLLASDLREKGPIQSDWPNYSKLGEAEYHCHLSYSWVACWRNEDNSIIIEVYYVGTRENAPY